MPGHWRTWCVVLSVVCLASMAGAQDEGSSSPYFDCPYVNYFDDGCPQLEKDQARVQQPAEEDLQRSEIDMQPEEDEPIEDNPELLLPLFPRESLAPDTPDLYRMLLIRPTLDTARRYVRWYERRMSRIREAQALVEVAGRELLAERAAGE